MSFQWKRKEKTHSFIWMVSNAPCLASCRIFELVSGEKRKTFIVVLINAFTSFIITNTFPLSVRSRALRAALGGCFSLCCISIEERSLSNWNPQAMSLTEAEKKSHPIMFLLKTIHYQRRLMHIFDLKWLHLDNYGSEVWKKNQMFRNRSPSSPLKNKTWGANKQTNR